MPYEELQHTADWSLRIWAADLEGLFAEAAQGMNALSGARPASGPIVQRTLNLSAPDIESLLVAFLSELVYSAEQENLVFDIIEMHIEGITLKAGLTGAPLAQINKTIKAVTYHNLQIRQSKRGVEVEIVFDV